MTAAGGAATLSCRIMFKDGKSVLVAKEEPNRSHEEDVKIKDEQTSKGSGKKDSDSEVDNRKPAEPCKPPSRLLRKRKADVFMTPQQPNHPPPWYLLQQVRQSRAHQAKAVAKYNRGRSPQG